MTHSRREPLDQLGGVYVEGGGEADDVEQRHVGLASLDVADIDSMQTGHLGEALLGQWSAVGAVSGGARLADSLSENSGDVVIGLAHRLSAAAHKPSRLRWRLV